MSGQKQTIVQRGDPAAEIRDLEAAEALRLGELVEYAGDTETVRAHSRSAENTVIMLVDNLPYSFERGSGIRSLDDRIAPGDYLTAVVPNPGNRCNVPLADGEAVSVGDYLVSNGDGTFRQFDETGDAKSARLFRVCETGADRAIAERI